KVSLIENDEADIIEKLGGVPQSESSFLRSCHDNVVVIKSCLIDWGDALRAIQCRNRIPQWSKQLSKAPLNLRRQGAEGSYINHASSDQESFKNRQLRDSSFPSARRQRSCKRLIATENSGCCFHLRGP